MIAIPDLIVPLFTTTFIYPPAFCRLDGTMNYWNKQTFLKKGSLSYLGGSVKQVFEYTRSYVVKILASHCVK